MHTTRARCTGQLFVLCLLALFFGQVIECRPDGAPIRACGDMVPQHASSPQSSASPYTIKPEKEEMWSNGTLEVTLQLIEAGSAEKFKGFLMMAFDDAGSVSPIGTFNLKDMGQGIDCRNDGTKSAVTHKDRQDKSVVVATWTPPQEFDGSVVFKTTFVKSASTFWVKQKSPVVRVKRAPVTTADETTTKSSVTTAASATGKPEGDSTRVTSAPIPNSSSSIHLMALFSVVIISITGGLFMA